MNTQKFLKAGLVWFLGLPITIAISYFLRESFDISGLGMPEPVWFAIHITLFLGSLLLIFKYIQLTPVIKKILLITVYVALSGIYYILLTSFYIIESGIDSI
jgi:hypothetical protein